MGSGAGKEGLGGSLEVGCSAGPYPDLAQALPTELRLDLERVCRLTRLDPEE